MINLIFENSFLDQQKFCGTCAQEALEELADSDYELVDKEAVIKQLKRGLQD